MSQTIPQIEIDTAFSKIKSNLRTLKSYSGLVKSKLAGIDSTLAVILEKATALSTEAPSSDLLTIMNDITNKLYNQIRYMKDSMIKTEVVSDALDIILG